jgi:para-aminobenzoate synthetase component 1
VITAAAAALAPAEAARRAAAAPGAFWLAEPAPDEVSVARDLVGADPVRVVRGASVDELEDAWREERARWSSRGEAAPPGVPIAAGWLGYDLGTRLSGLPARQDAGAGWPELEFHFHDAVWSRAADGGATIFARDEAAARALADRLAAPAPERPPPALGRLTADHPERLYLDGVARVLEYLRAGDAYQVNLARRLSAPCGDGDPVALAATLRRRAPAPLGAFIAAASGGAYLIGSSPERFLAVDTDGNVETRPIKGTRARGADPAADEAARAALGASAKDRAEHVMIVDLERNDLGRVCRTGSVEVAGVGRILALPTVFHMVSTVRGRLRPDVGLATLLRATFPGGSITGAPKRRAMQIIDELEPVARGPYTGATGWLGAAGDLGLAVAIRTALVAGGRLSLSVGGGVVVDSTPEAELAETEVKARAFASLQP